MRSPEKSPKKGRPSTDAMKKVQSMNMSVMSEGVRVSYVNNFNIVREVNGKEIVNQDKDIEIERLKTTCYNLNHKASIAEDLKTENEMLKRRIEEFENVRSKIESENQSLRQENKSLRSDLSEALSAKTAMAKDLD